MGVSRLPGRSAERERSTSRGQFIPWIAAASGAGGSRCRSWLEPKSRTTPRWLDESAQTAFLSSQSAKMFLPTHQRFPPGFSLRRIFLRLFREERQDSLGAAVLLSLRHGLRKFCSQALQLWAAAVPKGSKIDLLTKTIVVFLVLFVWQKHKKKSDRQVTPEIMPKCESSGNLCTIYW